MKINILRMLGLILCLIFFPKASAADKVTVIPLWTTKDLNNVVTVSKTGGDFTDPVVAINSITDASENNPYLLVIGPGVYTLTEPLVMKEYVSIAGAGEKVTTLTGAISTGVSDSTSSIIIGADNASLRWLTVKNTGGGTYTVGIYINSSSPAIQNVTIDVSGATNYNYGMKGFDSMANVSDLTIFVAGGTRTYGVYNGANSDLVMTNVEVFASGGSTWNWGVYNYYASPEMMYIKTTVSGGGTNMGIYFYYSPTIISNVITNVSGSSSSGIYVQQSSVKIQRSILEGESYGLYVSGGIPRVSQSTVIGGSSGAPATTCVACDNGMGVMLNGSCL